MPEAWRHVGHTHGYLRPLLAEASQAQGQAMAITMELRADYWMMCHTWGLVGWWRTRHFARWFVRALVRTIFREGA